MMFSAAGERPRRSAVAATAALLLFGALCLTPAVDDKPSELPLRMADKTFWRMVEDFSEANGAFRSDNLVSNEKTFQYVIPELTKRIAPGGVYVGVGPDQNFTYISALRPRIAFIVDIRRQNMLLHLMYKAIVEQSADRAEFLSRLFSRPRPPGADSASSAQALFGAYATAEPSETLFEQNLRSIDQHLVARHHFPLSASDLRSIEYIYRAFFSDGPDLRYSFGRPGLGGWRPFPTYAELMTETDRGGENHAYLSSEERFATLRALEAGNLIVPLVGNFAGGKALRSIGAYLRDHRATVTAFYTSNVEQYLFQGDDWRRFCANVAGMPADATSTMIRAFFNNAVYRVQVVGSGFRSETMLEPLGDFVAAYNEGQLRTYGDVIERSR